MENTRRTFLSAALGLPLAGALIGKELPAIERHDYHADPRRVFNMDDWDACKELYYSSLWLGSAIGISLGSRRDVGTMVGIARYRDGWILHQPIYLPRRLTGLAHYLNQVGKLPMMDGARIGFDPWECDPHIAAYDFMAIPQTAQRIGGALKVMRDAVERKAFFHTGDATMRKMVKDTLYRQDSRGDIFPMRESPDYNITGVLAASMAISILQDGYQAL